MAMKGAPYSSRPQHYWDLTIRLFSVITRTLIGGGVLPLCRGAVSVFSSPSRLNGNEGVRRIPQSSCITVTSLSDYLGSNQGHLLEGGLTLQQRSSGCILQPQPRGHVNRQERRIRFRWRSSLVVVLGLGTAVWLFSTKWSCYLWYGRLRTSHQDSYLIFSLASVPQSMNNGFLCLQLFLLIKHKMLNTEDLTFLEPILSRKEYWWNNLICKSLNFELFNYAQAND